MMTVRSQRAIVDKIAATFIERVDTTPAFVEAIISGWFPDYRTTPPEVMELADTLSKAAKKLKKLEQDALMESKQL